MLLSRMLWMLRHHLVNRYFSAPVGFLFLLD